MAIRLLALDLDGTLLDAQGRIPDAHKQAVAQARAQGVDVLFVTGRSWRGCRDLHQELGLTAPAITYAGGQVISAAGTLVWEDPLPEPGRSELLTFLEANPVAAAVCVGPNAAYQLPGAQGWAPDFAAHWDRWNSYTETVGSLLRLPGEPLLVAVYGRRSVDLLQQRFPLSPAGAVVDVYDPYPGATVAHIWAATVSKGRALARFCALNGYLADEVLAAGDQEMDRDMLAWAGIGVAMAAAPESVKAAAKWVAPAGDPHPVATAIERFVLGSRQG